MVGLLDGPRAREAFLLRSSMDPPWSLRIEDEAPLTVVAMVRGEAWYIPDDGEPVSLQRGDVAIVRGPDPYTVADDPGTAPQVMILPGQRCTTMDGEDLGSMRDLGVRTWGNAADGATVMLTGSYHLDGEVSGRLLRALPTMLALRQDEWDCPVIPLLADEIVKDEPGQEAVLDRLLDLLLISVLRAWFARPEAEAPGWYRAYSDPVVGRALRLLQNNPARPVDGRRSGPRDRRLQGGARPALPRAGRRAADDLPHRLAYRARRRPAARAGRHDRLRRPRGRLRQPVRPQRGLQAGPRHQPPGASRRRGGGTAGRQRLTVSSFCRSSIVSASAALLSGR